MCILKSGTPSSLQLIDSQKPCQILKPCQVSQAHNCLYVSPQPKQKSSVFLVPIATAISHLLSLAMYCLVSPLPPFKGSLPRQCIWAVLGRFALNTVNLLKVLSETGVRPF